MTAIERRRSSEEALTKLGIVIVENLPPIEEESNIRLRTPAEIAERILVLTYLNCRASGRELKEQIITFLKQEGLWQKISQTEKALFDKESLSEDEESFIRWRGEAIWLLLWVINKVDDLALPVEMTDPRQVFSRLPGFMSSPGDFIHAATIRPLSEIMDQADLTFRLTWAAMRQDQEHSNYDINLNYGIAHERHYAVNWVISATCEWDADEEASPSEN
jgi:hypothetical protein